MSKVENKTFREAIELHIDKFFEMHDGELPDPGLYDRVIKEVERILIKKTIEHTGKVQSKAAGILGINRNTLRKKIKDLKVNR